MSEAQVILVRLREQMKALEAAPPPSAVADDPPPQYNAGDSDVENLDSIEKTLESPETQKTLKSEISKLGTAAQDVEIAFRNVSQGLANVVAASEKGRPDDTIKLGQFSKVWDGYHKKYVELVWESRRVAGNARAVALDFAGDFVETMVDDGPSIEEKKQEIEGYREELRKDMDNATKLADGFKDLHNGVAEFRTNIKNELHSWAEETTVKLNALLDDIERVEKELEVAKYDALKATLAGAGLGVASGILTVIGIICPLLWIASAYMSAKGAYSTVSAACKYIELLHKREVLKEELETHTKTAETVSGIIASVSNLEDDMAFIQEKLAIFASVWTIIHSDLNALEKELELASGAKGKLLFKKRMKTVSAGYKVLAQALRLYETNVHLKH